MSDLPWVIGGLHEKNSKPRNGDLKGYFTTGSEANLLLTELERYT
jgi:hypothetical protein